MHRGEKALCSVCGTAVSLTPAKSVILSSFTKIKQILQWSVSVPQFKGVISALLIQIQSSGSAIRSLQHSSSLSYLSWVYLALIFSWLTAPLRGISFESLKISLRKPVPQKALLTFQNKQPGETVLPAQVPNSRRWPWHPSPPRRRSHWKHPRHSRQRYSCPRCGASLCPGSPDWSGHSCPVRGASPPPLCQNSQRVPHPSVLHLALHTGRLAGTAS